MDLKTPIKKLGDRKKIEPKYLTRETCLIVKDSLTFTVPTVSKSDVLFGHHWGGAGEPPSISGHVSRATGINQPKTLHASHL
jgi:hypothetical protein